jgi:hypothetical protein
MPMREKGKRTAGCLTGGVAVAESAGSGSSAGDELLSGLGRCLAWRFICYSRVR